MATAQGLVPRIAKMVPFWTETVRRTSNPYPMGIYEQLRLCSRVIVPEPIDVKELCDNLYAVRQAEFKQKMVRNIFFGEPVNLRSCGESNG